MANSESSQAQQVSVIIPCYQQGHFLSEAIESVLAQTLPAHEIIVVDDGSRDNTAVVAARYPSVRYIHQENSGVGTARNRGMGASTGSFLVFLDADDRLLSNALEIGANSLNAHPDCAFAFGRCQYVDHDGSRLELVQPHYGESDDYLGMLRTCPIWHPAAVISRRTALDVLNGFNATLAHCSDYDYYLRVTQRWPIHSHNQLISEYRQHHGAKSGNSLGMLNHATHILRSQLPLIEGKKQYEEAYRTGIRNFQSYYYRTSIKQLRSFLKTGKHGTHAWRNLKVILRIGPRMLAGSALRRLSES